MESALEAATWVTDSDVAAIALARRLATLLDYCFDTGDTKEIGVLSGKYLTVLQQLHLTVDKRITGKQGEENDGTQHVGDYLRLINSTNTKQDAKPAKRRTAGQ